MDLNQAYRTYRVLLMSAVAHLGRQGFHAPAGEALDLVHGFFLEEWPSIEKHYDENRGNLRPYIYAAFIRYARHAIMRQARLRAQSLDDLDEIAALTDESPETGIDARIIMEAMQAIPSDERKVLEAFLEISKEREVARNLGISRHTTHEMLARSLARVALASERPADVEEDDWKITRLILENGMTIRAVARDLDKSPEAVRAIHQRNLRGLMTRLRLAVRSPAGGRGR